LRWDDSDGIVLLFPALWQEAWRTPGSFPSPAIVSLWSLVMPESSQKPEQPAKNERRKSRQPEKKIGPFAGGVGVAIWINRAQTGERPKTFRSVTINPRRYYDEDSGSWKDAGSYNPTDLPALIFALQQAQAYVFQTPLPGQTIAEGEAPAPAPPDEIPF
jgi:hypothetical protein